MASSAPYIEDIVTEDTTDRKEASGWRRPEAQRNFYPAAAAPTTSDFDEFDDKLNTPSEFLTKPRCKGVVEWINSLLFDVVLLILETAINLWLATTLSKVGLVTEYRAIVVILVLPSLINSFLWLRLKSNYSFATVFVFVLLFIGYPSPLFLYLWHLYLSMFASVRDAENSKLLSNTFRMVHAVVASMPLMIINLSTLVNQLKVDGLEEYVIDLRELKSHMAEVHMHGLAFVLSFVNFVRAASLYNERQTMTLLFGVVALPFTILTTLFRVLLFAIVVAFVEPEWTVILFSGLLVANIVLLWACRKGTKVIKGQIDDGQIIHPITQGSGPDLTCSNPGSQRCLNACFCNMPKAHSGKYVVTSNQMRGNDSCWIDMGKFILLAAASVLLPSGYSNDYKMHHPRIKGGLYVILNYLVNMSIMGVSLGYTILNRIPNEFHGISIPNPSFHLIMPSSKFVVETGGMDVAIHMPNTKIDLGSMPSMNAALDTKSSDEMHAILVPVILAALCLPFTIMRAALMELECFVVRRKQLGDDFDDLLTRQSMPKGKNGVMTAHNRRSKASLTEILTKNVESKGMKARVYVALLCSGLGMLVMTMFMMLMGALVVLNL